MAKNDIRVSLGLLASDSETIKGLVTISNQINKLSNNLYTNLIFNGDTWDFVIRPVTPKQKELLVKRVSIIEEETEEEAEEEET